MTSDWIARVLASFREVGDVDPGLEPVLETLGKGERPNLCVKELGTRAQEDAAALVLHAVESSIIDHHIDAEAASSIESLKSLLGIEEGDLLALQGAQIQALIGREVEEMLVDDSIDDHELLLKSGLQRAFDLGYDQLLALMQTAVRPVVDNILAQAYATGNGLDARTAWRLQRLGTFVKIDHARVRAIWPKL